MQRDKRKKIISLSVKILKILEYSSSLFHKNYVLIFCFKWRLYCIYISVFFRQFIIEAFLIALNIDL